MIVPPQSAVPLITGAAGVKTVPQLSVIVGTVGAATSAIQSTVVDPAAGSAKVGADTV